MPRWTDEKKEAEAGEGGRDMRRGREKAVSGRAEGERRGVSEGWLHRMEEPARRTPGKRRGRPVDESSGCPGPVAAGGGCLRTRATRDAVTSLTGPPPSEPSQQARPNRDRSRVSDGTKYIDRIKHVSIPGEDNVQLGWTIPESSCWPPDGRKSGRGKAEVWSEMARRWPGAAGGVGRTPW